jgi:gliding motility-associated-like protein
MVKHPLLSFILSAILIGSFTGLNAQTSLTASLNTPANAGVLSESCSGPYTLVLERSKTNKETTFITISDLGVAQGGLDYSFPPGSFPLEMLPEDTVALIPVNVVEDGLAEGLESLTWEIAFLTGIESGVITFESGISDDYDVEILSPNDTIQWCRFAPLQLSASSTAQIHWSPTFSFDDPQGAEVTVRPFLSGWYYATVGTDTCGAKDSIYLDLAIVEIQNPDTVYICKDGEGIQLNGILLGLADNFKWIPSDTTLSDPAILVPVANPTITTTYILQSDFSVCIAADTVVVRVDSIPYDLHIDIAPFKAYYCAGEVVALFSPLYDSLNFPDIAFEWKPDNNTFETDMTLLNAALTLQDTTMYIRDVTNNACVSKDSILINVVPPAVPISVTDTVLCPGEMFMVAILSNQVTEPEWTPTDGLSCNKCLNPNVTVIGTPGTTVVYQFSGKVLECPVGASLIIEIPPYQPIGISGDQVVCPGQTTQLGISNPEGMSNFNWSIIFGDASLSCTSCTDPIVTVNSAGPINVLVTANTINPGFCSAQGFIQITTSSAVQSIEISGDNIVCLGDVVPLTITDPTGLSDFHWEITFGNASLSCSNCESPVVTINDSGPINVTLTSNTSDPDFCSAGGFFQFVPGEQPQVTGPLFKACLGGTVVVNTGNPEFINVQWDVVNGDLSLSCSDCQTPTVTVNSNGLLRFFAESTDPDVCRVSGSIVVEIFEGDESNIIIIDPAPPAEIVQGSDVTVLLGVTPTPASVEWKVNGSIISSTSTTIEFNADEVTNFIIATFINSLGCEQIDTLSIVTIPPSYMIPNAFTPDNGDERNDVFKIIITGNIVVEKFLVFNRWGQKVYDSADGSTEGWDGTWKNEPAASDTYVYTATLVYPNGRKESAKGDIMLLR